MLEVEVEVLFPIGVPVELVAVDRVVEVLVNQ